MAIEELKDEHSWAEKVLGNAQRNEAGQEGQKL